jgi:hypothetical protein
LQSFKQRLPIRKFIPTNLQIPVDDAQLVQVVDGADDLGAVELGPLLGELALLRQVEVQLAAVHVLRHQAKPVHGREAVLQLLQQQG